MSTGDQRVKKERYFEKLTHLLGEYKSIFVVNVDNVGSNQMHQIRHSLRGDAQILMGKNTMVRKVLRGLMHDEPAYEKLLPLVKGNVGFVFTNSDLNETRTRILGNRVQAPAKAGGLATVDVTIKAGPTGMEPGKTSFFQALGVPTKIAKGMIEITSDVHLVKENTRVGPSEAALLNMLNISPFTYGMNIVAVYDDGTVFEPEILDITDDVILGHFTAGIRNIAALSMAMHYPTIASIPHVLVNGYKNVLNLSLATDYTFEGSAKMKEYLADPSKFAVAATPSAGAGSASPSKGAAKAPEPEEESEEEDTGFDLFD